ncbi:MAG TPA: enolase C-terminal domain-like protein [Thermoleophilaceae bacterium]|nr:enolase C-terminal domain-like protein [Thermoleophilaceae bacterium]
MPASTAVGAEVESLEVSVYTVPLEDEESDGTLEWSSVTMILVEVTAGGQTGLGYTYGDQAVATLVRSKLADHVEGADALCPEAAWASMQRAIRNAGRPGVGAMAISGVDVALWDLKAKLLGVCLADALPRFHRSVPVYGSGGFTSYSDERLAEQLSTWVDMGIPRAKIKTAREPDRDPHRLKVARNAIGDETELLVDANGAFTRKDALLWASRYSDFGVTYLEEPVTSEDREGLRMVRDRGPAGLAVAAGEYEWDLPQLADLSGCVDILQADVTRCGGVTNMLRVDGICKGRNMPFSAHCAPAISAHVCCAIESVEHIEYFHDHVRAEKLLFDGTLDPRGGSLEPDRSRPGLGLELKRQEAAKLQVRS